MKLGDKVWVVRTSAHQPVWIRGIVRRIDSYYVTVETAYGEASRCMDRSWAPEVRVYSVVDELADLQRCSFCTDWGQDRCRAHASAYAMESPETEFAEYTASSDTSFSIRSGPHSGFDSFVLPIIRAGTNMNAISQLGNVFTRRWGPPRRPLTRRARAHRRVRHSIARASRRRNR